MDCALFMSSVNRGFRILAIRNVVGVCPMRLRLDAVLTELLRLRPIQLIFGIE